MLTRVVMWQTIKSHLWIQRTARQHNLKHVHKARIKTGKSMLCDKCRNEAVFFQPSSGRHLCRRHLAADIEVRAKRAIRSHHWMKTGDHIAVTRTRDKKSAALLFFLKKIVAGRRDIRLSVVPAGTEETDGCCLSAIDEVAGFSGTPSAGIPEPGGHGTAARDRPTKIALAVTLDDIASDVLVRFLFGNAENLIHPPQAAAGGIEVICPFIAIPSEELDRYRDCEATGHASCPPPQDPLSREVETLFCDYHHRHPATRFALLNLAEGLSNGNIAGVAAATGRGITDLPGVSGLVNSDGI
jgi:hypothetical protein